MPVLISFAELCATLRSLDIGFELHGDPPAAALSFCSLRAPEPRGIYFAEGSAAPPAGLAECVVIARNPIDTAAATVLVENPQVVFYRVMRELFGGSAADAGAIHPTAIVDERARVDPTAVIGPYCVVGDAQVGARTKLVSHVVVYDQSEIGNDVTIEPHSVIGATGVAWVWDPATGERVVQPQTGGAVIGDGCFLGSDVTVVRGSVNERTSIGEQTVIAHGTKIGHGCRIGAQSHFANNVSVAGNVEIGSRSFLGSGCVLRPMVRIAEDTVVAAGAVVVKKVETPGMLLTGVPAVARQRQASHSGVPAPIQRGGE